MDLSLRKLRYFVAVAETGKVTQAAVDLNVSQSSITTGIRELEDRLGVTLFVRRAQGMQLTHEGQHFLQHAMHVLQVVAEALDSPRRFREPRQGKVRVATTYTVAGYFLPAQLARFKRRFPGIQVELQEVPRSEIESGLEDGRFDMAVMLTSNLEGREHLCHLTLVHSRRRLWTASHHPLLEAEHVSFAEIAREPYIMLTVDECMSSTLRYWSTSPYRPDILFQTSSVEAVRSMIANGMGVTILSDMVYRPWSLEGQRVETITLSDPVASMDVGLVWAEQAMENNAVRAFKEFLAVAFAADGSVLERQAF